jgi:hypothetical protein
VAWIVRLVKTEADGEKQSVAVVKINRPDDLIDIVHLGLTLAEGNCCWRVSSKRSLPRRPELMPFGDRIAEAVARFVV